jgi:hypothetical protein
MTLFARASASLRRSRMVGVALSAGLLLPLGSVVGSGLLSPPASASVSSYAADGSTYHAVQPTRIADTRANSGYQGAGGALSAGQILTVQTTGFNAAPVPFGATAVVVNVTAVGPTAAGYLTAYASGQPVPSTSTVDFVSGQTVANEATIAIGSTGDLVNYGKISIFNYTGTTNVVVDVEGYYTPDTTGTFYVPAVNFNAQTLSQAVSPIRVLDTRQTSGIQGAGATLGPQQSLNFYPGTTTLLPGSSLPVVPPSATAVVLNVTATNPTAASYLTLWAEGGAQPLASNLNFLAGQTVSNRVIVPLNSLTEQVSIFNWAGNSDVVVDLDGYYDPLFGTEYYPLLTPTRIADTRSGSGYAYSGQGLRTGSVLTINVPRDTFPPATGYNAPSNFAGIDANITVTDTTASSYLTVYPSTAGATPPLASDLNWVAGRTVASGDQVTAGLSSPSTAIDVFNYAGNADVIVDVYGYFAGGIVQPGP